MQPLKSYLDPNTWQIPGIPCCSERLPSSLAESCILRGVFFFFFIYFIHLFCLSSWIAAVWVQNLCASLDEWVLVFLLEERKWGRKEARESEWERESTIVFAGVQWDDESL